jgi:hypothetical protein
MPIQGRILLLPKEGAYILAYLGWISQPGDQIYERLALNNVESRLDTGNYRPASLNPQGGIDWGWEMMNDVNGPWPSKRKTSDTDPRYSTLDPFQWLDPLYASSKSLEYARANSTNPFRPWAYGYPGAPRTAATIGLAEMIAVVGPKEGILDPVNSPYWRMKQERMNVGQLPEPPLLYVTRLPLPVLKYGDSYKEGRVNQLQRILKEDGRYPGGLDNYFGARTRGDPPYTGGVKSVQRDLQRWGVWDGPIDGIYSDKLFEIWDAMLEFDFYTRWS